MTENQDKGKLQIYIESAWEGINKTFDEGGVFESQVASAEAFLSRAEMLVSTSNGPTPEDVLIARNIHTWNKCFLESRITALADWRAQLEIMARHLLDQTTSLNDHAIKSLTLANGGAVLATLAFIANNKPDASKLAGLIWIIGLCAVGFLLTLIGSPAATILNLWIYGPIQELLPSRISAAERQKTLDKIDRRAKVTRFISWPIFYLSGLMLAASAIIAICVLARH